MTKWVENKEVVFTCEQDIYKYLSNGGAAKNVNITLNSLDIGIAYFINGKLNEKWNFSCANEWDPVKRAEWYEDIPENGVLGKAYPGRCEKHIILLCTGHDDKSAFPFKCQNGMGYSRFIPFTKEEVLQYILPD